MTNNLVVFNWISLFECKRVLPNLSAAAGHFADALIKRKWTVLSVRRLMTALGLVVPALFLLIFSAVQSLTLAVL